MNDGFQNSVMSFKLPLESQCFSNKKIKCLSIKFHPNSCSSSRFLCFGSKNIFCGLMSHGEENVKLAVHMVGTFLIGWMRAGWGGH